MNMKIENMAISNGYRALTLVDIKKIIEEKGIETLRLEYIDMNGVNRGKILPACMIDEMFEDGIAFAAAIMVIGFDNSVAEVSGLSEYNYDDMKVFPDPSTFMVLPYLEKTALILGDLYYHGKKMTQSPRWFLKNMIREYNNLGLSPIVASEMEFFLFRKNENEEPIPYTNHDGNCYTANNRIDPSGFLAKLTSAVRAMDFDVLYMNHEFYAGQYEYNWKHNHALNAADQTATFKGVCKDIAELNDLHATFMARPVNQNGGSGCHVHLSLNDKDGRNVFFDENDPDGMSQTMKFFVGGVLKHAKALTALLSPTINCYKALHYGLFCSGQYRMGI